MNELRSFERKNTGKIWYSDKECKAMRIVTQQAVQGTHKRYLSLSPNQVDNADALDDCIVTGIENLLTPNIIKKSKACRAHCLNEVLDE